MNNFIEENNKVKRYLLKKIKESSLFIGSRAWGVETEKSDYDYLIQKDNLNDIFDHIQDKYSKIWQQKKLFIQSHGDSCDREQLHEFYSIIININDKKYNIISPTDLINYRAWRSSAIQMSKFIGDDIIKEKQNRVDIFECFKKIYRNKYTKRKQIFRNQKEAQEEDDVPF